MRNPERVFAARPACALVLAGCEDFYGSALGTAGAAPYRREKWRRYQFRNLGQTSADRALNFAATNAFLAAEGIADGLLSARLAAPGTPPEELYSLDIISVSKSPYCRMDSDCQDVQIRFFNRQNVLQARNVYQFTIDVSDEMPVSLAPRRQFLMTS